MKKRNRHKKRKPKQTGPITLRNVKVVNGKLLGERVR